VIKSDDIDYSDHTKVLEPKIDGASSIFELNSDKPNKIYSYRVSKKSGINIDHSDQVPKIRDLSIPDIFNKTILRGELFAQTDNHPMPAEQVSGILNSSVSKSLETQKDKGWLQSRIYDIIKFRGRSVANDPYGTKLSLIKQIEMAIPEFKSVETAYTPEQKSKLVEDIKRGRHPETKEGVVSWDLNKPTGKPEKLKFRDNFDVYIRQMYPAINKASGKEKEEIGGFRYSLTPRGKIVGNVGTGFSREQRIDMLKNQDKYLGMVARVKSQQQFSSGSLRTPSYYGLDVEKNLEEIKHASFINELKKMVNNE
jgi:ATP-dependent DNA ligase